jgi:uncharacterized protein with HEPN domain
MPRNYQVYFEDILNAITNIEKYTEGLSFKEFSVNSLVRDAVIRNLEVIGEAVKDLPEEVRQKIPGVNWRRIAGLRDILIHRYFEVDVEIMWDVIRSELPVLKSSISASLTK